MLNKIKDKKLSPVLAIVLATSVPLSVPGVVRGESLDPNQARQLLAEKQTLEASDSILLPLEPYQGIKLEAPLLTALSLLEKPDKAIREESFPLFPTIHLSLESDELSPWLASIQHRNEISLNKAAKGEQFSPELEEESTLSQIQLDQDEVEPRVLIAELNVDVNTPNPLSDAELRTLRNTVYDAVDTQPGRTTTRSQLQEDVNAIFATGFFSNVRVEPEDTPLGVRITFFVDANPKLKTVVIETLPAGTGAIIPPDIQEDIFGSQYGQILNLREFQEDIKALNQWYQDNGYDLAQVIDAPEIENDGTVTLVVAEGIIEDIRVQYFDEEDTQIEEGGYTRPFIVTREVQLKPGDVFNRNTAQRDLQRVFGLGLFEDVRLSFSPGEDPSKVIINVDVVEGNTGSIAAGAGISSASGLFGTVSYQQQNFGGNNHDLGAEFQLGTRELLFSGSFTDPWIAGDPYRTSYTVNGFRRRSISLIFDGGDNDIELPNGDTPRILRTGGGIRFGRPIAKDVFSKADWRLSAGFQYQRISIRDSDGDLSPVDELGNNLAFSDDGNDDLFMFQFNAVRDNRNNALQPTSGSFLRLGVDQTAPLGSGSILMNRLRASYSFYYPIQLINFTAGCQEENPAAKDCPQALAFNIQGGTVFGDLPPYEAFSLGGSNSVRGYDEGDVGSGRRYVQATAEYRFPLFNIINGALFMDYATDLGSGDDVPGDPAGVREKPGDGFGYGVGVRIQSPLGPIRVDYGLNDQGDSRIHFGIGERF